MSKNCGFILENWVTMLKIAQKCPIFLLCLMFSNVREPSEPFLSNLERTEPVIKVSNRTNIEHMFEVHPPLLAASVPRHLQQLGQQHWRRLSFDGGKIQKP